MAEALDLFHGHGEFVQGSGELSDAEFTSFLTRMYERISEYIVDGGLTYSFMDWRHIANMADAWRAAELELVEPDRPEEATVGRLG